MLRILKLLLILVFGCQFSCVEKCNGDSFSFRLRMETRVSSNDTLYVVYTKKSSEEIFTEHCKKQFIEGNEVSQFVEFCFPNEPRDLRIYFSEKTENKYVKVLSVLFENNDRQVFFQGSMLKYYLRGSKNYKFNEDTNTFQLIDVSNQQFTKPYIQLTEVMKKRLENRLEL